MDSTLRKTHWELIRQADDFAAKVAGTVTEDPHRLGYHIMAPSGWINDPNGLVYYSGEYHVFYQYHPYSSQWGPMHWGHVKSKDLVHWKHLPTALAPSEPYDQNGCFSGSAVDDNGILTLIYTGNVHTESKRAQVQCIAVSIDGVNFSKSADNPVIGEAPKACSPDFRDPKVWRHGDSWYMVVGYREGKIGKALLYESRDLRKWKYVGVLADNDGSLGYMWECPDFFSLDGKHILIISPMGVPGHKSIYLVGDFDYRTGWFDWQHYAELDYGHDFYAPQTLAGPSGRRILFGWMNMWGREQPTAEKGWAGALTIPRELRLLPDGTLSMLPVSELRALRKDHVRVENIEVSGEGNDYLASLAGDQLEIVAVFELAGCTATEFGLEVRCSPEGDQGTSIIYHRRNGELIVDLNRSGAGVGGRTGGPLKLREKNTLKLRIFIDRSSVEVFGNEGRIALSSRIYPNPNSNGVKPFATNGSVRIRRFDAWKLKSIW